MGLEAAVEPELVDHDAMVLFDVAAPRKAKGGARASRSRELPVPTAPSDTTAPHTGTETLEQMTSPEADASPREVEPAPPAAEASPLDTDTQTVEPTAPPFEAEAAHRHSGAPPAEISSPRDAGSLPLDAEAAALGTDTAPLGVDSAPLEATTTPGHPDAPISKNAKASPLGTGAHGVGDVMSPSEAEAAALDPDTAPLGAQPSPWKTSATLLHTDAPYPADTEASALDEAAPLRADMPADTEASALDEAAPPQADMPADTEASALHEAASPQADMPADTVASALDEAASLRADMPFTTEAETEYDEPESTTDDTLAHTPNDFGDYPEPDWDDTDSDDAFLELLVEEIAGDPADRAPGIVAPPMPAHIDEWERRVLADPHLLDDIAFAVGGPFHLMYPARVGENIRGFRDAFARAGVDGLVYYGKKANKAACVARACAENGAGVDVSSVGELTAALAAGVRGGELMVTGPAKSDDLLWLAVRHGALIAVDSLGELDRLAAIASAATPARVLLRVLPAGSASRFGMTEDELDRAQSVIAASGPRGLEPVQLEGFSFHLSGYDAIARAQQAADLIDRCAAARELGHAADTISIGGGFGVDYVPEGAWREFTDGVDRAWFHAGKSFGSYYPYHFPAPGPAMLSAILAHGDLADRLRDNDIRLAVEPGRALLDRAGSTVFRVQGSKIRHADGQPYQLLTVDGTSLSLSEQWFDSEYLPDPVLWPQRPGEPTPTSVGAASCLESDMLSWRRIPLRRRAEEGDLLVYPNTAGYQMDSNESAFHELPIPPKVVLSDVREDRLRWTLDAG
ncbi:Y4yA family PLP-dependent enzyme [Nocardia amikacinitolerans]|uniref:Y4yA family PLP-dependent enzyme n=1 Tax=Nocardia amikacinitolerans TaxID=756689 RepID=UPI0027E26A9C|nr:Y4yA family PLP-dependent enzyme [Nocardia amikacinitolerans]MCP2275126.1 Diaminopimelate decarboxylase [Nocardia amikacinitolerans]